MPILSNFIAKIVSLSFLVLIAAFKVLSLIILSGHSKSICLYGWHVSEEVSKCLLLVTISLIPDIIIIICISIGIPFKTCNIGADPTIIIYNFVVGLITICAMIPFIAIEDCQSDDLPKIKAVGIYAVIAGVLHITGGVLGFLSLADQERSPPRRRSRIELDILPSSSSPTISSFPAESSTFKKTPSASKSAYAAKV